MTKVNAAGSALVYSTYLGGTGEESEAAAIAVDGAGNAYVTGNTQSDDFPTVSPIQAARSGGNDAFVTKLNAGGSALVYSTYLGGSSDDKGFGIAVDASGNAYVTGKAPSADFPTTAGAFKTTGGGEAFVTKIDAAGSALVYSTFLGSSFGENGKAIAVDSAGNAYVTGDTSSTTFPTVNPVQPAVGGFLDAFVTKINAAGSALVYSTYLGGDDDDRGVGIAVDPAGNAYVTGRSGSANFPTASPLQAAFGGGSNDAFVTKLNAAGSALVYSTYLGGSGDDRGFGIAVDGAGNAYLTGRAGPTDFPTLNPLPGTSCNGDAFVTKLNAAGSALVYSTCLGGGGENPNGAGIAVDAVGNAYVTGATSSADFPTASFQAVLGGGMDAFVAKISDVSLPPAAPTGLTATQASPSQVDLAWSHDGSDETGFELERDTDQSGIFDVVGTVGADVLAFQDTSVQVNRSYTYQVKALGAAGDSAFSPSATVTVRAGKLLVLPVRLTFSGVAVGNSDTKTVTLQNVGQGTLTGSVASALSGSFTLLAGGGTFSLAPGATLSVTVQFSPTTRGTARSGLTVTSDDPARPATRVQVTGIVR